MTIQTTTESWIQSRIKQSQIDKYLENGKDFITRSSIPEKLAGPFVFDRARFKDILEKSLSVKDLTLDETVFLLNITDQDLLREMQETAVTVKKKVYDNRIVTFAPLYLGNKCVNNCLYCGFRNENTQSKRHVLSREEIVKEIEALTGTIGHKRLIVVVGEHPAMDINYMVASIRTIYDIHVKTKFGHSEIRRVNVNAPPLSIEELKQLKEVGIGTYQVFQETYHEGMYAKLHPHKTIKGDYRWRLYAMHRAMEAGIDDVGIGALFGLYDWKYEVLGLVAHSLELEKKFGIGAHTVSFPRLIPAAHTPFSEQSAHLVNDENFKRIITVIRLAIPYTGMILTCREKPELRKEALRLGITQTDASSMIGIGSYSKNTGKQEGEIQQFYLADTRSLDEVIRQQAQEGYITSFCTAGYRCGRTGANIMNLLRTGTEGKYCKLNAVLTFREWLDDFASPETKAVGEQLIEKEIGEIKEKMPKFYPEFMQYYTRIKNGERDVYV